MNSERMSGTTKLRVNALTGKLVRDWVKCPVLPFWLRHHLTRIHFPFFCLMLGSQAREASTTLAKAEAPSR